MSKKPPLFAQLSPGSGVVSKESDEALMLKVAGGDVPAFRTLYEKYRVPILSYLMQMTGSKASAEEITQEVFLRVYRNRESYRVEAKLTTWLWTIARNAGLDHLRRKKEEIVPEEMLVPLDERPEVVTSAEQQYVERATRDAILKCMEQLTVPQREAISLRTFSELAYEEIGEALGISLSSVKSLIHRARGALVDCLKGGGHGR